MTEDHRSAAAMTLWLQTPHWRPWGFYMGLYPVTIRVSNCQIISICELITRHSPNYAVFKEDKKKLTFFETRVDFVLVGMTAHWDEVGGRILLGDNPGCGAFVLRPVRFQYDGFWISNGLPFIYRYIFDHKCVGRDSAVGIATRYGLGSPRIESRWGRDFPHPSRTALGPTQPPMQWAPACSRE